jgi:CubicO group peptidase (beta-lactamase class C family)
VKKIRVFPAFIFTCCVLSIAGCHVGRFFIYNVADLRDHRKFTSRPLTASENPYLFHERSEQIVPRMITYQGKEYAFDDFLEESNTVAFLVIRNDSILCERYVDGYEKDDVIPSFSMAKSFTSILIGCAIEDGLIDDVRDPIVKYLPELRRNHSDSLRIEHLLQMTSGLHFDEVYYSPFADVGKFYYGRNLEKYVGNMRQENKPGEVFNYSSGDTQVLGMVLQKVLGTKTVTEYFQEKVWSPLGMEYDGSWSVDRKDGVEKTFCCVNARARDFARIGRLYLNEGNWNGQQLVPKSWVKSSLTPVTTEGAVRYYRYQWWFMGNNGSFSAVGLLGQYIYVQPADNLIIVRMGRNKGDFNWPSFFGSLTESYRGR